LPPLPFVGGGGGEVNTASNVGIGTGIFDAKVGTDLQFKSLLAGAGIALADLGDEIQITNAGGGYTGPQTPLTTGAFAYYPLQEGQGAITITDAIGGRNLTGSTLNIISRHPLFPARTMLRFSGGNFTSPIDPLWGSVDQTFEVIVWPANTGVGQLWFTQNGIATTGACQWDGGAGRYAFSWNGLAALSTPANYYFGGKDGTLAPEMRPYLLRVERENIAGTINVRVYVNGYLHSTLTTAVVPPLADRLILGNACPVFMSDMIVWQTANPPVSALAQAQRVLPYLF